MENVAVTGGSGFIGRHLCARLEEMGYDVFNYDLVEGRDILRVSLLNSFMADVKPKYVFHLAGSVYMSPAEEDPYRDLRLNCEGTLNIIERCLQYKSKLLFTGTGASYGLSGYPHREDSFMLPVSNYGVSKLACEYYVRKYALCDGLDGLCTRFSSVYGLGRSEGPINNFIGQALRGEPMTVYGPGNHTRDYIHVDDAVDGLLLAMFEGKTGELYNIGLGKEYSVIEIAYMIQQLTGAAITHVPYKYDKFDLPRSVYDISKMRGLGFEPKVDLMDGVKSLLSEMRV